MSNFSLISPTYIYIRYISLLTSSTLIIYRIFLSTTSQYLYLSGVRGLSIAARSFTIRDYSYIITAISFIIRGYSCNIAAKGFTIRYYSYIFVVVEFVIGNLSFVLSFIVVFSQIDVVLRILTYIYLVFQYPDNTYLHLYIYSQSIGVIYLRLYFRSSTFI